VDPLVEMQQLEGVSCSQQRLFLPNMERASKASALLSRLILLKYPQILISSRKKTAFRPNRPRYTNVGTISAVLLGR
jgi:hypothetical protein